MSISRLTREELLEVRGSLPDIDKVGEVMQKVTPDFVAIGFRDDPSIVQACVCFNDVYYVLKELTYALEEAAAYKLWSTRHSPSANLTYSNFFIRFYCDDAALRLYAAAEYLAEAIVGMFKIDRHLLPGHPGDSLARRVGRYVTQNMKQHKITEHIQQLCASRSYLRTINYRNDWVHRQPPLIEGCGSRYDKRERWEKEKTNTEDDNRVLYLKCSGDESRYTLEELHSMVIGAFESFTTTVENVWGDYRSILEARGVRITDAGPEITINHH